MFQVNGYGDTAVFSDVALDSNVDEVIVPFVCDANFYNLRKSAERMSFEVQAQLLKRLRIMSVFAYILPAST
jgi:hypothetical protein